MKPRKYNPVLPEKAEKVSFPTLAETPRASISFGTTMVFPTGGWRSARPVFEDRLPPCVVACPAGVNIEQYLILAAQKRFEDAASILKLDNPLPATTGRVCFHPCQEECNRKEFDGPVQIQALERLIGEKALETPIEIPAPSTGKKAAVIGSGPAGLAFAYQALLAGVHPVVFEKEDVPGGLLATGIPEYRLPKDVLSREVALLEKAGIEFRTGVEIGKDVSFLQLREEFDAVFVAVGLHKPSLPKVKGADGKDILTGLEFLYRINREGLRETGRHLVVVGGGNTAMDAARCALRFGTRVTVVYRRTREAMPAIKEEVEEAEAEGARFSFLLQPIEILRENGAVTGIRCRKMALGDPDPSGRRRPVPVPGEETTIHCDGVVFATGEEPDLSFLPEGFSPTPEGLLSDAQGNLLPGVLLGGDLVTPRKTIAHALGSGKKAFQVIRMFLERGDWESATAALASVPHSLSLEETLKGRRYNPETVKFDQVNTTAFERCAPHKPRGKNTETLLHDFSETTETLSERMAVKEASRCFNCGICNLCSRCFAFCPDSAVRPREDGQGFEIDYDYCKGCGICVEECPRGAMKMVWEEK